MVARNVETGEKRVLYRVETPLTDSLRLADRGYGKLPPQKIVQKLTGIDPFKTNFIEDPKNTPEDFENVFYYVAIEDAQDTAVIFRNEDGLPVTIPGKRTPQEFEYSSQVFEKALYLALSEGDIRYRPKVFLLLGPPRAGKSSFMSETMALTQFVLANKQLKGRRFVFVETPGNVGRGHSTIHHLAHRTGMFDDLDYKLYACLQYPSAEVVTIGRAIREAVGNDPNHKKEILERFGVTVHVDSDEDTHIGGRGLSATNSYYADEDDYFLRIHDWFGRHGINAGRSDIRKRLIMYSVPENIFNELPLYRETFIKRVYSWVLFTELGLSRRDVSVSINDSRVGVHLYQDRMDRANIFLQLQREGRLHELKPAGEAVIRRTVQEYPA